MAFSQAPRVSASTCTWYRWRARSTWHTSTPDTRRCGKRFTRAATSWNRSLSSRPTSTAGWTSSRRARATCAISAYAGGMPRGSGRGRWHEGNRNRKRQTLRLRQERWERRSGLRKKQQQQPSRKSRLQKKLRLSKLRKLQRPTRDWMRSRDSPASNARAEREGARPNSSAQMDISWMNGNRCICAYTHTYISACITYRPALGHAYHMYTADTDDSQRMDWCGMEGCNGWSIDRSINWVYLLINAEDTLARS